MLQRCIPLTHTSLLTLNSEVLLWLSFMKTFPRDGSLSSWPDIMGLQVHFSLAFHKLGRSAPVFWVEILVPVVLFDPQSFKGRTLVLDEKVLLGLALFHRSLSGSESFLRSSRPWLHNLRSNNIFYRLISIRRAEYSFGFCSLSVEIFNRNIQFLLRDKNSLFYSFRLVKEFFVKSVCRSLVHFRANVESIVPRCFMQRHILVVRTLSWEIETVCSEVMREKLRVLFFYWTLVKVNRSLVVVRS